ncbi:c-type cytochrome [Marinobacter sp. C2H3]|uniref:c-type cytochrome n=1 Tax=Marinobacter sp. C2H3 TaxID=3119003 RepID=UPI00300EB410
MKQPMAGYLLMLLAGTSLAATPGGGDPVAGESSAAVCAGCHGQGGAAPTMGLYPKLSGLGEAYLFRQLQAIQSGQREVPQMTGLLNGLSEADLRDLAAYFNEQPMTVGQASPDTVERAQALYRGGDLKRGIPACSACHSPNGQGNGPAGFPRLGGQSAEYLAAQLKAYRSGERAGSAQASIMTDIAGKLTDDDIAALANYLSGLH